MMAGLPGGTHSPAHSHAQSVLSAARCPLCHSSIHRDRQTELTAPNASWRHVLVTVFLKPTGNQGITPQDSRAGRGRTPEDAAVSCGSPPTCVYNNKRAPLLTAKASSRHNKLTIQPYYYQSVPLGGVFPGLNTEEMSDLTVMQLLLHAWEIKKNPNHYSDINKYINECLADNLSSECNLANLLSLCVQRWVNSTSCMYSTVSDSTQKSVSDKWEKLLSIDCPSNKWKLLFKSVLFRKVFVLHD